MRPALLLLAVLATTTTTTRAARRRALASTPAAEGSPQDEYVRHYDWTLPSVAAGPLWSQFPRRCFATNKLFNGYTKKWILVPTSHNNRTIQYLTKKTLSANSACLRRKPHA